ncbi:serine hydrolase domain-containing protein [Undibacterium sp. TS12]|uniref:serine hydrolase domain-containing protein n=1 Tax=Undibacterium sp. TS12 TaxID=2908202 RepID=UPI001F4C57CC|nr:serine hydrolase domain-containing protein [Undibacterium sp. TS12]MCH8622222.1 beta-lactamase family protein [Undibacterium sp. TS12]
MANNSVMHTITSLVAGCLLFLQPIASLADDLPPVSAQFQQLVSQHQVCSAALIMIKARQLQEPLFATGCPDAVMPDADSIFQAASLGKPVFAYAVLGLVAQGKLDLDKSLLHYLPQGYLHASRAHDINSPKDLVTDPRLQKITARMVLQHRSGLPNWANGKLELVSDPDTRWQYSGEGYALLQRVVETISGLPLDTFMQQQVFTPLGMTHSSYLPPADWRSNILAGSDQGKPLPPWRPKQAIAASTLHTSIRDYGNFVAAVLKNETLLRQITEKPVMADQRSAVQWGLGWALSQTQAQTSLLWHWGNNPGYRVFVIIAPGSGDGMVLLTNANRGLALAEPLVGRILPESSPLFRFPLLDGAPSGFLCRNLGIC